VSTDPAQMRAHSPLTPAERMRASPNITLPALKSAGFRCDWPISLVQQLSLAIPYINETIVILRPFTAEEPRARWRATFNGPFC